MTKYDLELEAAEELLSELAERLDHPVRDEPYLRALLALGKRARSLFRGCVELWPTDAAAAGFVLLRPAAEINLMLRYLREDPDLHTKLWDAAGELQMLKLINELEADRELAAKTSWPGLPADVRRQREEEIEAARAAGLAAGAKGVSEERGGQLLPSMHTIGRDLGDASTKEAYTLAYRSLSQFIHTSSRAFDDGAFEEVSHGMVTFSELADPEHAIRRHRALNATTFASTLTLLSEPLGLDVLEPAARVSDLFVSGRLESRDENQSA
jgi:hypothetical protein